MSYKRHLPQKTTGQQKPIREDQIQNSAGGYVFGIDLWSQLDRFLILGSVGGTYYISEQDLTKQNLQNIQACIDTDFTRVVDRVVEISQAVRATSFKCCNAY